MEAPTTMKQTTLLKDHVGGMKYEVDKEKVYDDVLNMTTHQIRDTISKGREPTQRKHDIGPDKNNINLNLKEYNNNQRDNVPSRSLNKNTDNILYTIYGRNKDTLENNNSLNLDPSTLNVLKNNPYVNNIVFNKNKDAYSNDC